MAIERVQPVWQARDRALDATRGIAVFGMVLVNLPGSPDHVLPQLRHSPWHGLTAADLVFPIFLVVVGASAAIAAARAGIGFRSKVLRRAVMLFAIGLLLGWLLRPSWDLTELRWPGVLQRIAIVYAAAALVWRWTGKALVVLGIAVGLMALHAFLLTLPPPGASGMGLAAGEGLAGWLDRQLPGRLHRPSYDPEGVLSTVSAIATALVGTSVQRLGNSGHPPAGATLAAAGVACLVLGIGLAFVLPINKALWTPSFALTSAGFALLLWAGLKLAVRLGLPATLLEPAAWFGRVALTFYVLHMLLIALLLVRVNGQPIWDYVAGAVGRTGLPSAIGSLGFALLWGAGLALLTRRLERRGWLIRV